MSLTTRRQIPMALISLCVIIITVDYYFAIPVVHALKVELVRWGTLGTSFAVLYGVSVEIVRNIRLASRQREIRDIINYFTYFLFLILFVGVGRIYGLRHPVFLRMYINVLVSSGFAINLLHGLYQVSAAYRTMKASSLAAIVLMLSACLMLMRNAPLFTGLWPPLAPIGDWLKLPLTAGMRGALIASAVGSTMIGLRTIAMKEHGLVEAEPE